MLEEIRKIRLFYTPTTVIRIKSGTGNFRPCCHSLLHLAMEINPLLKRIFERLFITWKKRKIKLAQWEEEKGSQWSWSQRN